MENRVLGFKGARNLTPEEAVYVTGGVRIHTETACTLPFNGYFDGDPGECGGSMD